MRPRADTLLVWTGAPCSYGCSACPIDATIAPAGGLVADLQSNLGRVQARERRLVVLVGGEPFLRPDFLRLVTAIRSAGCVPGLITTGRPLVYPQLRAKLRRAGLAYVRVQFFGVDETHDRATAVPGAFEQALTGLRAWVADAGTACDVDAALSIRRRPLATIVSEIEGLARALPSPDVQIVVAIDPAGDLESSDADALRRAVAALADWNDDATRPLLAWEGLPESVPPANGLRSPPLRPRFVAASPRACCLGPVDALAHAPIAGREQPRANSFNFVRAATAVPWTLTADACTAYGAGDGVEPFRDLWLVDGEQLERYATDTGDFDAAEITRIKDELSHLFLDRAPAGVLDDFTDGMRRVLPDAVCDPCANRTRCGRRFRVVDGPPFAREEAWIAAYIRGLRGSVLDVGCGEQLYRDVLAPLVGSGVVQYTGLDPDRPSLARLRAVLPEGRFHVGGIEDFRAEPARYDHILCLRSLNHVVDLDEALARMADYLKPGGSLLIVECTPLAMLRRPQQVAAADSAPRAGHQHFRNLSSQDVLPFARRRSLRILEHYSASLATTNEWILLLGRPHPEAV